MKIHRTQLPAVVSRGRSGTHWLCSLIYQWFYRDKLSGRRHESVLPFHTWNETNAESYLWADLLGGHINTPGSIMARELAPRKIIYLFRSARDSLPSMWRMRMAEANRTGKATMSFSDYLKTKPKAQPRNEFPNGMNVRDLTHWSQNQWLGDPNNLLIRYDAMLDNLDNVRDLIAEYIGIEPQTLYFRSSIRVGYVVPKGTETIDELWETVE